MNVLIACEKSQRRTSGMTRLRDEIGGLIYANRAD